MNNLAKELVNRLNALAARGAHLTLKVMKRAADAPVETPKFLGHGVCDLQNATHVFNVATADLAQIAPAAVRMMEKFSIPCSELRGVALQMTKLESISFHSGQQRLNFAATKGHADKPTKPESNQSEVSLDTDKKRLRSPAHSPSRSFKIPTATAPKKAKAVKQVTLMPTKTKPSISKKATIPMQSKIAADGALQLSVKQHKVYYPDKVTDAELASIGIDPSFFRSIPYAMRQDTLSNARAELIRQDGEKAKLKAFEVSKGFRGLDSTSSEAQLERINLEELNKPTSADPMFGKLEDIDQIRTKLQAWVAYAGVKGPADKDVRKLETYLIRCLEQNGRSPDLERVALVLSWLQWVVSQQSEAQQKAWQTSFQDLKERIDSKVVKLRGRHLCL